MITCTICGESKDESLFRTTHRQCKSCRYAADQQHVKINGRKPQRIKEALKQDQSCEICGREDFLEFDHIDPSDKTICVGTSKSSTVVITEAAKCRFLCMWCHRLHSQEQNRIKYENQVVENQKIIDAIKPTNNSKSCSGKLCKGKKIPINMFPMENGKPRAKCNLCMLIYRHDRRVISRQYVNTYKINMGFCQVCDLECVEGIEICFDWDHVDPSDKKSSISDLIGRSEAMIDDELRKCRLLCCFCHFTHTHGDSIIDENLL